MLPREISPLYLNLTPVKLPDQLAGRRRMGRETECPVCDAYIPVDEDVREGDFIYCGFCLAQLRVTREMLEDEDEAGTKKKKKIEVEEDYE